MVDQPEDNFEGEFIYQNPTSGTQSTQTPSGSIRVSLLRRREVKI